MQEISAVRAIRKMCKEYRQTKVLYDNAEYATVHGCMQRVQKRIVINGRVTPRQY